MRQVFSNAIEEFRIDSGAYGSQRGDRFGSFVLKHPKTKTFLFVMACADGLGWDHVSVTASERCPTWDEMCWVKDLFFDEHETVVQYHPAKTDYVNVAKYCLHLWRPANGNLPTPPKACV